MRRRRHWLRGTLCGMVIAGSISGAALAAGPFGEPDALALHTFDGEQAGDGFGWEAENIGDITGDGVNEFITAAPFGSPNGLRSGKAYIFSGAGGPPLHTLTGNAFDQYGYAVSRAGDANRDGVPDYIVGGPGSRNAPVPFAGRAAIYSGADHTLIHELHGPVGVRFGADATGAGDLNGDGYDDVIVGAPFASFGAAGGGSLYSYSGADGTLLWRHDGTSLGGQLGLAVGSLGDINADGVPDVVVGAPYAGPKSRGEAFALSGVDGAIIHTLRPAGLPGSNQQTFGWFFASGPGDVDRDGVPDIFIGDWNARRGGVDGTGRAYVFSGKTGKRLFLLNAERPGDGFGVGRGIGDIDGDGHADLIIAAYTSSAGAPFGGKAYIVSGRRHRVLRTITGTLPGDLLGVDALAIGDVNGDRLTDFLLTTGNGAIEHVYVVAGVPVRPGAAPAAALDDVPPADVGALGTPASQPPARVADRPVVR